MGKFQVLFCAVAVSLLAGSLVAQQPGQRLRVMPSDTEGRVSLEGDAAEHMAHAERLGELSGDTALPGMSLILKPSDAQAAALTQLIADQADPASPAYHQWLTPEQFGARFGAADTDIALLKSWLAAKGFTVQAVAPSKNQIVFSGSASAAQDAFRTTLRRFRRDGREFFEPSDAVQLPVSMAAVVNGVTGLSSYRLAPPQAHRSAGNGTVRAQYTTSTGGTYIVPWDLRQMYGSNSLIGSGYDGTGIKIGVIGQSAVDTTQITYFQQKTGQKVNLPTAVLVPNTGVSNRVRTDESEAELDVEYSTGNAPGASIQLIYTGCTATASNSVLPDTTNCNNGGVFDALTWAVTQNLAPILSLSYGACEASLSGYANRILEPILKQSNAQGQTILVASGDQGAATCESSSNTGTVVSGGLAVSYPASSQYVTAVGGTTLNGDTTNSFSRTNNSFLGSALGYVPEVAWNDTVAYGSLLASGGGLSKIFPRPSWQVGNGVPASGGRAVPDVAFPANVAEHAFLTCDVTGPCTSGTQSFTLSGNVRDGGGVGGTSAGTPSFAGMLAIVEQANGGKPLGNLNPNLYALAQKSSAASIFHDIITGNNFATCAAGSPDCTTGTLGYAAGPGYDLVTGLGSIAIPALQSALAGYAATTPRILLSGPTTTPAGTPVTYTATVAGSGAAPTGTVTFSVDSTVVGSAQQLASGSATFTYAGFTSVGSHIVSAAYAGNGTYGSGTASLAVSAQIVTPSLTLTVSPVTFGLNTAAVVTATLSSSAGTPSGTISFTVDGGATTQVQAANGVATYTLNGFTTAGLHVVSVSFFPAGGTPAIFGQANATKNIVIVSSQTNTPTINVVLSPTTVAPAGNLGLAVQMNGSGQTPTGQLLIAVDGTAAGTATLSNGAVTTSVTAPQTIGTHALLVTYYGDNNYSSIASSTNFTVANPTIAVAVSPGTLSATYGSSAAATLSVTSMVGASGAVTVNLSLVSSTGAAFTGCYNLAPTSPVLPANGTVTAALTMRTSSSNCPTTANRVRAPEQQARVLPPDHAPWQNAWAAVPLPILLLLLKRRRRVQAALFAALLCAGLMGLNGCGGTNSTLGGTTGTTTTPTSTTGNSGSYVIRATATLPTATGNLTSSTTFTLNVQ